MDKNKKSKTFNKMSIRKGISLSLAALTLAGPIVPYAVYANPTAAIEQSIAKAPEAKSAYPTNIIDEINWDEKATKGDDYWALGKSDELKNQRLVRVTTTDPIEIVDVNYQGYFIDANGRTNLRLTYLEKSAAISAVWKKAAFNFGKLYDKIDFDKSYGVDEKGNKYTFSATNNASIKTLDVSSMISARTQNKNNLPINVVLKDGVTIGSLGKEDYKIQMRLVDAKGERIYAFAPGKAALDYSTYTSSTSVSLKNNMNSEFLRGPGQKKGDILAVQRSFMSEFIANPIQYDDTTNLGVIRTQYQSETGANPGNTTDGKPHGFMQMFDADMVGYLKADDAGFIAYTQLLNADRTVNKNAKRVGIKLGDLNYTADGKKAYFIIGESNFQKDGVTVVRTDNMKGSVYTSGIGFTAIDYVVDKAKFIETFESTGTNKVDFSVMTGWIETNPKGWTIFEEAFDHDYVVPEGESFTIDLGKDPEGGQMMIQVGDEVHSFVRTQQGYYAGYKGGSAGFEKIEQVKKGAIPVEGLYKVTLREGATIKKGDKLRIILPDSADHDAKVNFVEVTNGSKYNQGAALLKIEPDRNINMHLYRKDKGSFKLYYTLKGETEQKVLEFTQGGLWKYNDKDKVLTGVPNKGTDPSGGNFWINTTKLEPGSNIIVEAYNEKGEKEENHTSYFVYNDIDKATEKYTKMAWVDHSDDLAGISVQKSLYTPYQEIYTNDYTGDQQKDFYENPRQNPKDTNTFMTNTSELLGFTKYDGGKIRMRYIDPEGKTFISKTDAAANEYNDNGEVTKDYTKTIKVNGKEYVVSPYKLSLKDFYELKEDRNAGIVNPDGSLTLVKDMRMIVNASDGSSIPSDWLDVRVKSRVLFDTTDGAFEGGEKQSVKVVPDNVKYFGETGYAANGFTGDNVKAKTGDTFPTAPTAEGKTFLGWVTKEGKEKLGKTIVKAEVYNNLDASMKFTSETAVTTHQVVYAIWSEEKLITFDANGGKFADGSTTKTDDLTDGVTEPANPTLEGKKFLGWASTKDAKEAEKGILDNVTDAKTVYAVWGEATEEKTEAPTITKPNAGDKVIKGTAPAGSDVTVTLPDGTEIKTKADDKGNWTADVPADKKLAENDEIKVVAKDGDKAPSDEVKETVGPKAEEKTEAPTITKPNAGDKVIKGTAPAGSDVTVTLPDGTEIKTKADDKGNWTADVPADKKLAENDEIKVVAKDGDKAPSDEVKETVGPKAEEKTEAPTITKPNAGDKVIKGTAPAGSDVTVTLPDGTEIKTKADDKGNWTADVPADKKLAENDEIKVVAKDGDKAPSDEVKETVGAKAPEEKTTAVDSKGKKPVNPTDEKQGTGIKVTNPDDKTKVTVTDEDGKEIPAEINPTTGEIEVTPGTKVDGPLTVTVTDDDLDKPVVTEVEVNGHTKDKDDNNNGKPSKPSDDDKTSIDDSNVKPVEPTDKDQGTGVIVNNPEGTTITAEDEDGKYVPVTIDPATGEIIVNPGKDVDGPIKVTIKDKDGKVRVIYIDVIGHSMCIDDNDSEYRPGHDGRDYFDGIFKRHEYTPTYPVKTVVPEKTSVGTPVHDTLWYVFHINEYEYEVVRNGVVTKRLMDVTPVLRNNRTMLPLRYVAEAIGADVKWDAKTRTATFTKDGLTASIQVDGNEIVLSNGKTIKMDSKPLMLNNRVLVSVVNVANVFGLTNGNTLDGSDQDIEWQQEDKSATIYIRR